jgi:HTH-type transcriptional regulator / antitoxin HigA
MARLNWTDLSIEDLINIAEFISKDSVKYSVIQIKRIRERAKLLKTETDYRAALKRLEAISDAKPGSPDSDELDKLGLMVDDYENKHYPIEAPDPIEAIKIRMEELHLKQVDLIPEIGGKSRVSEVLNRKRRLTVEMIRKLTTRLNLSSNLLIKDYQLIK